MLAIRQRKMHIGAEFCAGDGVHFRVWAPRRNRVEVIVGGGDKTGLPLEPEPGGYFSGKLDRAKAGDLYQFRLDGSDGLYPDPASRSQPDGPHGPSEIVDGAAFQWTDQHWPGVRIDGQVIYEMHIGTFTPEGTWNAAARHFPELLQTGITLIELMPVAAFPGKFGWGYDGVNLFAPTALYGSPDEFRRFVDCAHSAGLAVILDVVYNHFGPDGNYLREFSETYFSDKYANDWGEPLNFDGLGSEGVREFFIANARYWIDEFHLDGLRLDATQQIFDASPEHIIKELTAEARRAAIGRNIVVIGENEPQHSELVRGYGLDALWNDDFHHAARVALTNRNEAYYSDYLGTPQEFISALKWGFLYQGQRDSWQKVRRGTPAFDLKPASFITFIQNHDQIANSVMGERIHQMTSPGRLRALTALMLLGPGTPLLFQGQEFAASTPFHYFADHHPGIATLVHEGRQTFMKQFPSIKDSGAVIPAPHDRRLFDRSKLIQEERSKNAHIVAFHRDLIALRRSDPVFRAQRADWIHGAVLSRDAFVVRFFGGEWGDRLIILNLGRDFQIEPAPEPLLTGNWRLLWSSELPEYKGCGRTGVDEDGIWRLSGETALVLTSENPK